MLSTGKIIGNQKERVDYGMLSGVQNYHIVHIALLLRFL